MGCNFLEDRLGLLCEKKKISSLAPWAPLENELVEQERERYFSVIFVLFLHTWRVMSYCVRYNSEVCLKTTQTRKQVQGGLFMH